ncbi:MAG: rhamnose ABC transporter substrate-binding protein [Spirochaetia bacterium]
MRKVFMTLAVILVVMAVAAPIALFAAPKTAKFAIVFKNTGNPYGDKQMGGFKDGIEEQGYQAILRAPDQPTAEAQIQIIEQLISQRVAAICIVGNDKDALQPVLTKAKNQGIKVFSLDSGVNPASRLTHVNQADSEKIGRTLVQAAYDMIGGAGDIAILSATSQATNQNLWIDYMKKELALPKYAKVKLVKVAYGDDIRDKSVSEAEGLLASYPNLKCIIAPTTVGIAAAGKVLTDKNLVGKVFLTGLGLPSEMATYIENGVCPYMFLWNPIDVGYLGAYVATALVDKKITGKVGDKFAAGRLGNYTITKAPDGGTEVLLGPPFKFDKANIGEWKTVY